MTPTTDCLHAKGLDKVLADIAKVPEQHPAEQPIRELLLCMGAESGGSAPEVKATLDTDGEVRWTLMACTKGGVPYGHSKTLSDALDRFRKDIPPCLRRARVAETAERLVREQEAADAATRAEVAK